MSRSKHAVELCALLVDETYGELTSRIFTILLRRGRLPISLLSKHTRLTPRQLRHGLAVLLQQNLIYHSFDEDTGSTHYEANEEAAYGLVRSGKIIEAVADRHGPVARDIVCNLLLLGHITVHHLEDAYTKQRTKPVGDANGATPMNGINGESTKQSTYVEGYLHTEIARLLQLGIVETVQAHMFLSPSDTYNKAEKEMLQAHYNGSTKGTKQKEELKLKIQVKLRSLRAENQEWQSNGKKRPLNGGHINGINGNNKRRRLSNDDGTANGNGYPEDDGTRLDPNLVIRINYEKCNVLLRNQRLVALAHERIGKTTSVIYDYALRIVEKSIPRCRLNLKIDDVTDLADGPTFTTLQLTRELPHWFDPRSGIGKGDVGPNAQESDLKVKLKNDNAELEEQDSSDEDEDGDHHMNGNGNGNGNGNFSEHKNSSDTSLDDAFDEDITPRSAKRPKVTFQDKLPKPPKPEPPQETGDKMVHVRNHLMLLAADQCKFIRKCGGSGLGEWTIDFEEMIDYLRNSEIDSMVLENFGVHGHRLTRMLRKMGKLDEKTLPNLALMKQKDVRTKLAEMQMAGIVDIQEVPRDTNRTVGRLMLFWYFDTDRVATIFLENLYKKISRVFQRLDIERQKYTDILSITERSDVRDLPPEDYLVPDQLKLLGEWKSKQQKLLSQIHRLDELVGIFRDY